jgi:hypothetical protein
MQETHNTKEQRFIAYLHSGRFIVLFLCALGICFSIGWGILIWNENRIRHLSSADVNVTAASDYDAEIESVSWKRDDISLTSDYVTISGHLYRRGTSVERSAIRIVLKDPGTGNYLVLPTDLTLRTDITEKIHDGNNYDYCGFSVRIPYWDDLSAKDYEIFAQYDLNDEGRTFVPFHTTIKKKAKESEND